MKIMKHYSKIILTVFLTVTLFVSAYSQDRRTTETKVADILAKLPGKSNENTHQIAAEIIGLGADGIARFCDLIVPPGTTDDTQSRYAISSLVRYVSAPGNNSARNLVETAILKAVEKASDKDVKMFFIEELAFCGQASAIPSLAKYLNDPKLYAPALSTITTIGTDEAGKVVLDNIEGKSNKVKADFVKTLGDLQYEPAEMKIIELTTNEEIAKMAYYALANIGGNNSAALFQAEAKKVNFDADKNDVTHRYLQYARRVAEKGDNKLSTTMAFVVLSNCKAANQMHYKSSALEIISKNQGKASIPTLLKEFKNSDKAYRQAVLNIAAQYPDQISVWVKAFPKASSDAKVNLLYFLAPYKNTEILSKVISPSLSAKDQTVRQEAILALAINQKNAAIPTLLEQLRKASENDMPVFEKALLAATSIKDCKLLADELGSISNTHGIITIINVLAERRATSYFDIVQKFCSSDNEAIKDAAYKALEKLASAEKTASLLNMLPSTKSNAETEAVQRAITSLYTTGKQTNSSIVLKELSAGKQTAKLIPLLPFLGNADALKSTVSTAKTGSADIKDAAVKALTSWNTPDALPHLYDLFSEQKKSDILNAYLRLVSHDDVPDDQKLLWLDKIIDKCSSNEKARVIQRAGQIKTFLSLIFVSKFLDDQTLSGPAANSAMRIALPVAGKNGMTGTIVKDILKKTKEKITGNDSQYYKIDIQEYIDKMPDEQGYVSIFNGKDLDGWQGLVRDPIARSKMTAAELAKAQEVADKRMFNNWTVKDGYIVFNGHGGDNLCTVKKYKDFDMIVDWRITKDGDSGIYLRGTPQVQIWDTSRVDVGAQVGSGGLYNNSKNPSKPLVLADNAIGDWNTFYIRMVGERVTVYLNGVLVVDNVIMENYWNRRIPIFSEEAIELQAHGTDLAFRNIYVREINPDNSTLSDQEKKEGFESLFNGRDLDNWVGNKTAYYPENGILVVSPDAGGQGGNLLTLKEYSNFNFRFEFQLTPGANNGLGIHTPLEGDAAYQGKELQILDNSASIYANLEPYQYHGSVYGIIAAKRGFLKPVGEWNSQEVIVNGDDIKIILNGEVIVDGNLKEATKNGTPDKREHPGLNRYKGHIGFLGHGSELKFRNIRIKEL